MEKRTSIIITKELRRKLKLLMQILEKRNYYELLEYLYIYYINRERKEIEKRIKL